ncbi:hypothetical protein ETA_08360 [Erwinia tasmaniensis Et1/99]|uniref:Uncharacterized protein n=1 Tax=Erwinia tasmaniensis (strain DSM 17950 / CFBP 7177 / CIP 109463 / NCPPB 4357 / Et1/99) TaxID=465817 RepID=B2VD28_ERWT9|nr:hypothetical protein ETA_08360 [Erwinia tasmaniensis Et1/99]
MTMSKFLGCLYGSEQIVFGEKRAVFFLSCLCGSEPLRR